MSASTWIDRAKNLAPNRAQEGEPKRRGWIGLDLSGARDPRRTGTLVPLLVLVLLAALGVASLRIDLIRTRYALATAMEQENALIEEQRALIVRKRQFRDPAALAAAARERGFRPPARVFTLPDPSRAPSGLPQVAAGPRRDDRP